MQRTFGIIIDGDGAIRVLDRVGRGFDDVSKKSGNFDKRLDGNTKALKSTDKALSSFNRTLAGYSAIAGAAIFTGITFGAIKAGKEFERLNRLLSGSELEFVRREAELLGLDLLTSATGFSKLTAAAAGTSLEGQKARDIFIGLNTAVSGLSLSTDQANGALRAFEQIISKGTVQAEELRGQLGERIPGAFQLAARAMNLTTVELNEQLRLGQVISDEFLPKFAAELERTYSGKAITGAQQLTAEQNRFNNAFFEFQGIVANSGAVDALSEQFRSLTQSLSSDAAIAGAEVLGGSIAFLLENMGALALIGGSFALARVLGPQFAALATQINLSAASAARFGVGLVALNARAAATTAVMGALRSSLALIGGPAGLAILAGTGIAFLATRSGDAEEALNRAKEAAKLTSGEFSRLATSSKEAATEVARVAVTNQNEFLRSQREEVARYEEEITKARASIENFQKILAEGDANTGGRFSIENTAIADTIATFEETIRLSEISLDNANLKVKQSELILGDLKSALEETISPTEKATESANNFGNVYGDTVTKIIASEEERRKKIAEITSALNGQFKGNKALQKELEKLTGTYSKLETETEKLLKSEQERIKTIDELEKSIASGIDLNGVLSDRLKSLKGETDEAKTSLERFNEALDDVRKSSDESKGNLEQFNRAIQDGTIKTIEEAREVAERMGLDLEKLGLKGVATANLLEDSFKNLQRGIQDSFFNAFRSGEDFFDSLKDTAFDILAQIAAQIATTFAIDKISQFFGFASGGGIDFSGLLGGNSGSGGGLLGSLGGLLGGNTSSQGPVDPNSLSGLLSPTGVLGSIGKIFAPSGTFQASLASIGPSIQTALVAAGPALAAVAGVAIGRAIAEGTGKTGKFLGNFGIAGGIAARVLDGLGIIGNARTKEEVLQDETKELFGNRSKNFSAFGADGKTTGFAGGNAGVFGGNFGISGSGITSQLLGDGGENGNGGFFTGAQGSLDGFAQLLRDNGFTDILQEGGVLRVLSKEHNIEDIRAIWQAYRDSLDESVAFTAVFNDAVQHDLIAPTNLFFENFATGMGQNAFEARDSILAIELAYEQLRKSGLSDVDALSKAFGDHYQFTTDQTNQFFSLSGNSIQHWANQFNVASQDSLRSLLDFNERGEVAFSNLAESGAMSARVIGDGYKGLVGDISGILGDVDLGSPRVSPPNLPISNQGSPSPQQPQVESDNGFSGSSDVAIALRESAESNRELSRSFSLLESFVYQSVVGQ